MSKADEMFEKLGYEKFDNHPEDDYPPEPNMWTTQDERTIEYIQKGEVRGHYAREIICFHPRTKNIVCSALVGDRATIVPLSMQELQAINLKCKELGWIE